MRAKPQVGSRGGTLDWSVFESVARALEPLATLYVRTGYGAGEFTAAAKLAFIKAAATASGDSRQLNVSAVSVATGLTRKEIRSFLEMTRQQSRLPAKGIARQRSARVVEGWQSDPEFVDRNGEPALLVVRGNDGTFESLVKRYGGDVPPVSVLRELERNSIVSRTTHGRVKLRRGTVRSKEVEAATISLVANQIYDMASTLVVNALRKDTPTFTAFRESKSLSPDVAAVFIKTFTERSAMLLEAAEQWFALQPKQRHAQKQGENSVHRVGIGVYLVDEPAGSRKPMPPRRQHRRKAKVPASV